MLFAVLADFTTIEGIGEPRLVPRGRPRGRGPCDGFLPEGDGKSEDESKYLKLGPAWVRINRTNPARQPRRRE